MSRRNMDPYQVIRQDGIELLVLPDLARHTRNLDIDLKEFLFLRNLKAVVELSDGMVLGRRPSWA
jgi:hypothetical protein